MRDDHDLAIQDIVKRPGASKASPFGPYSDTVTFTVESFLADGVIEDRSQNPKYSDYRPGPHAQEMLALFAGEIKPWQEKIHQVVNALGNFSPNGLELIATLHFIARRQKQIVGTASKQSIVREFKSIKRDKFSDSEIDSWYDALVRGGLI